MTFPTHKTCNGCREAKPLIEFSADSRTKRDGRKSRCKVCLKESSNAYRRSSGYNEAWLHRHPLTEDQRLRKNARTREWKLSNRSVCADMEQKRRAVVLSAFGETVDRRIVFEKDQWICQLCGGRVVKQKNYPDPMSASLDHRLPLSRGGKHTYANTQLAHLKCNVEKKAKIQRFEILDDLARFENEGGRCLL